MDERDRRIEGLEMLTAEKNERLAELRARVKELDEENARLRVHEEAAAQTVLEANALRARVKELEAQRVPNPGVVGTLRDKNTLLEYKDAQIAQLQDRVHELEVENAALKA